MDTRLVGLFCVVSVVYLVNVVFASELDKYIVNLQHDTKVSLNFLVSVTYLIKTTLRVSIELPVFTRYRALVQ